jgi:hypothetical protein
MLKEVEIDSLSSIGANQDEPPYQLPPEAWSLTNNCRSFSNGVERLKGWLSTFGTPSTGPIFLLYVASSVQPWWLWTGANGHAFAWDGVTNNDITNVSGPYAATDARQWNGCILGGIPVLNDGVDAPQVWLTYSAGTKLTNLANWPASTTCRVMRAFLSYLIALNVTVSGTNTPHRVRWSTEASPGSVPSTWDVTDSTKDAGQVDIPDDDSGLIMDGLGLRGQFFVYKEASVWRFQFVGGTFIFDDRSFLDTAGLLATRCVCVTGDGLRHVFLTQDDLMWHNGLQAESILTKRFRRYFFNQIDPANYAESFVFTNALYNEVWVCYPSNGSSVCNRVLIWNYGDNTLWEGDINFQAAEQGTLNLSGGTTWAAVTKTWASDTSPWMTSLRRKVVVCDPAAQLMYLLDSGTTRNGAAFTGTIQRTGLSVVGRKRTGEWIEDFEHGKLVSKVWPKVVGGPINVRVGYQNLAQGPVTWGSYQPYDPTLQQFVDGVLGSGKAVAIEFSSTNDFRLDGYKLDMSVTGKF